MGRNFRWLWAATSAANLGDGVVLTALPLLALAVGSSAGEVSLLATVATLAWPVFGLHAGWIVDRVDRRRLLVIVNAARALALAALAVTAAMGELSLAILLVVAAVYGIGETLADTALVSTIPMVVGRESYTSANARIEATANLTNQFVGPPLAGLAVGISATLTAATGSALYAIAAFSILLLRGMRQRADVAAPADHDGRLRSGLAYLVRHPLQRSLTVLTAAMSLVWGAWIVLFVLYVVAPGPLGLSGFHYGLLLAAMAVGGLLGSIGAGYLQSKIGTGTLLFLDCIGTVLLVGPAALGANAIIVGIGVVVAGAGSSVWRILVASIRQSTTPTPLLGRVYSASRVISWGARPIGTAAAGLLTTAFDLRIALLVMSVVAVLCAVGYLPLWRMISREVDTTVVKTPAAG